MTESVNGETHITYFYRAHIWENELIELLLSSGLERYLENFFVVKPKSREPKEEGEAETNVYGMIDWMCEHTDILSLFTVEQKQLQHTYYIGEIKLQTQVDSGRDWFDIKCTAVFGQFLIPFSRLYHHILHGIREYVLPNGQVAILPEEWFARYYELILFGKREGETIRLAHYYQQLVAHIIDSDVDLTFQNQTISLLPPPRGMLAQLRSYQQQGFSWLVYLLEHRFGGCLADDMGLGKTLQTIALLLYVAQRQNQTAAFPVSLLVVPTSLLHNWQNEIKRFAPTLKYYAYSGGKRIKSNDIEKIFHRYHVVITTYGTLRNDIEFLRHCRFEYLILDESQIAKNPESIVYKAVKQIVAEHKLVLTGTPIENSLSDLWAQFDIINEGMLGTFSSFKKAYIHPIINKKSKEKEEVLLKIISPFLLRRTKEEVASELPPLVEEVILCDMSDEQKSWYEKERSRIRNSLIENIVEHTNLSANRYSFLALQGLTRLRLLANHPILMDKEFIGASGKFEQVVMQLESLRAGKHKALIFSAFVKHLHLFSDYFDQQSWKYAMLTGATVDREKEITRFRERDDINCFFISLKAGGLGLNLTAADYVFILDPWWNPAAEMQAVSRAHRIGQEKNVMVYRFISTDTIEEKIVTLQKEKSQLAATFINTNRIMHLSMKEVDELLL